MKHTKHQSNGTVGNKINTAAAREDEPRVDGSDSAAGKIRTTVRDYANPANYRYPYEPIKRLAEARALGFDCNRTRHASYRQMRLVHEHVGCDPERVSEKQLTDAWLTVQRSGESTTPPLERPLSARSASLRETISGKD